MIKKLNFSQDISERINKAYSMLWLIRRNFRDIGPAAFVLIYKHLVRLSLEYNNSVWAPYRKSDIDKLEKVQKRATKMIQVPREIEAIRAPDFGLLKE